MGGTPGVGEGVAEAGPRVDLDEQARDLQVREPPDRSVSEGLRSLGQLLGGQRAEHELAVGVEADLSLGRGEQRLHGFEGCVQLLAELVEAVLAVGGDVG